MKGFKKIVLVIICVFCLLSAIVFMPSISSIFAIAAAVITLPIEAWQNLIGGFLTKTVKIIFIIVLIIAMSFTAPIKDKESSEKSAETVNTATDTQDATDNYKESAEQSGTDVPFETETHEESTDTDSSALNIIGGEIINSSETDAETEPVHIHAFSDATCTSAAVCSCGEVTGEPLGHCWIEATCSSPKTCSVCFTTEGGALTHSYSEGYCVYCSIADPDAYSGPMVWIPVHGGTKYHCDSDCSNMKDPEYVSRDYAISQGFDACKRCY